MTKRPISPDNNHVFFRRDSDGDAVMIAPADDRTMAALDRLSEDHELAVMRWRETLVVEHGESTSIVLDGALDSERWRVDDDRIMYARGGRRVCASCPVVSDCPGATLALPEISFPHAPATAGLDELAEIVAGRPDGCRLTTAKDFGAKRTLSARHLRAVGLEPVTSFAAFTDDDGQTSDADIDAVVSELAAGTDFSDAALVEARMPSRHRDMARIGSGYSRDRARVFDMIWDDRLVAANLAAGRYRGALASDKKRSLADYRANGCDKCLYGCAKPPWDHHKREPDPLTEDDIVTLTSTRVTEDSWRLLTAFAHAGVKAQFNNPATGYEVAGIGAWPTFNVAGEMVMEVRRLAPDYDRFDVPIDEYLARTGTEAQPLTTTERDARLALWALHSIMNHFRYRGYVSWFDKAYASEDRMSRNAVLAVELSRDCRRITVHSDSYASHWGGFGCNGASITVDDRPRFTTTYHAPFAGDIWGWLAITPDACEGRRK